MNKRNILIVGGDDIAKQYSACEWAVSDGLASGIAIAPVTQSEENKKILANMAASLDVENSWMFVKGNVHTEDFLQRIIPLVKALNPTEKVFLSHCAYFTNPYINQSFILTDAACVPAPTPEQRTYIIKNAIDLFERMHSGMDIAPNVSFISAGGSGNPKTDPELHNWWSNTDFGEINVRLEQLDVALNEEIRKSKGVSGKTADIVVVKDINQGNAIWKSLTAVSGCGWSVSGLLMGANFPIILSSRGDDISSIKGSIKLGAMLY